MAQLEIRELTVEYSRGEYVIRPIDNLWLSAEDGNLVVMLGPSGCGKTTLLSCLGGILKPTKGLILHGSTVVSQLDGAQLESYRRTGVGICFQAFNLIPSLSALENVAAPLLIAGVRPAEALAKAKLLLERVDLAERMDHRPGNLSGGQQQRVAVARALVHDPPLVLADEPTANLDYVQAESVIRLVREIASPGRMVVVSTHDDRLVPIADQVVELAPRFRQDTGPPQRVSFRAGETIFEQGARGELVYVIDRGEVDIIRTRADRSEEYLATKQPGEYFGELGPLLGFPRSALARARTDVSAVAYGAKDFKERVLAKQQPEYVPGRSLLGAMSQVGVIPPELRAELQMPPQAPSAPPAQPARPPEPAPGAPVTPPHAPVTPTPARVTPPAAPVTPPPGAVTPPTTPPAQVTPPRFCVNCGTPREPQDRFCGNCGMPADQLPAQRPPSGPPYPPQR